MHRAGKPVDLRAFDLVAGVAKEVGNAPNSHSVDAVRRQRQRALRLAAHPSNMKPRQREGSRGNFSNRMLYT